MTIECGASKSPHAAQPGSRERCLFGDLRRGGSIATGARLCAAVAVLVGAPAAA
jgi:hypothetical protein